MRESDDLYEILQVQPSAELEVIQAAYRRLASKNHPDVNESPDAEKIMKRLNDAYKILSNQSARDAYDVQRSNQIHQESGDSYYTDNSERENPSDDSTNTELSTYESFPSQPKSLFNRRIIAGILGLGIIILLVIFVINSRDDAEPEKVIISGRSLELHTTFPEIVEKVAFTDTAGQLRVIRPRASNRQLVVTNVIIVNRTSLVTPLLIDPDAVQLGDRRGDRINALNPFEASRIIDAADPELDKYTPLLWGEVNLDKEFQVEGWLVFDVPKGLILGSLWWEEVDTMIADFVDYQRRRR